MDNPFEEWAEDYGLYAEPNYNEMTRLDCLAAFEAGERRALERVAEAIEKLKASQ